MGASLTEGASSCLIDINADLLGFEEKIVLNCMGSTDLSGSMAGVGSAAGVLGSHSYAFTSCAGGGAKGEGVDDSYGNDLYGFRSGAAAGAWHGAALVEVGQEAQDYCTEQIDHIQHHALLEQCSPPHIPHLVVRHVTPVMLHMHGIMCSSLSPAP